MKIKNPITISKIKYCQYLLGQLLESENTYFRLQLMHELTDALKDLAKVV